MLAHKD